MSYRYKCDEPGCNTPVEMTQAEFMRLPTGAYGRRVRCAEHQSMFNINIRRAPSLKGKGAFQRGVVCSECGGINPVAHYRLDPRNWREQRRLLCLPCGVKLSFTRVDHTRVAA